MAKRNRDPRTKEELLDRMLSYDFDGDIRHLGVDAASIVRTGANRLRLTFPNSGRAFELTVRIPRELSRAAEGRSFAGPEREAPEKAPPPEEKKTTRRGERKQTRAQRLGLRPRPRAAG